LYIFNFDFLDLALLDASHCVRNLSKSLNWRFLIIWVKSKHGKFVGRSVSLSFSSRNRAVTNNHCLGKWVILSIFSLHHCLIAIFGTLRHNWRQHSMLLLRWTNTCFCLFLLHRNISHAWRLGMIQRFVSVRIALLGSLFGSMKYLESCLCQLIFLCCRDIDTWITAFGTTAWEKFHDVRNIRVDINGAPGELNPQPSFVVIVSCTIFINHRNHLMFFGRGLRHHLFSYHQDYLFSNDVIVKVETLQTSY